MADHAPNMTFDPVETVTLGMMNVTSNEPLCGLLYDFVIEAVIMGILCMFGFTGNILSMIVLWRDKSKTATPFLLVSLEIADTLFLATVFILRVMTSMNTYTGFPYNMKYVFPYIGTYVWPIALWATTGTIWITVLVTLNRFVSVCRPYEVTSWCSISQSRRQVIAIWIVAFLYNLPRFFEYHITPYTDSNTNQTFMASLPTALGKNKIYQILYGNVLYFLVMFLVPLVTLVILNCKLIKGLRRTRHKRAQLLKTHNDDTCSKSEEDITYMLIVVVLVFVVCQAPAILTQILRVFLDKDHRGCPRFIFYYERLSDLMVVLNSSMNFLIYCFCSEKFRRILVGVLCNPLGRSPRFHHDPISVSCTRQPRPTNYTAITVADQQNGTK